MKRGLFAAVAMAVALGMTAPASGSDPTETGGLAWFELTTHAKCPLYDPYQTLSVTMVGRFSFSGETMASKERPTLYRFCTNGQPDDNWSGAFYRFTGPNYDHDPCYLASITETRIRKVAGQTVNSYTIVFSCFASMPQGALKPKSWANFTVAATGWPRSPACSVVECGSSTVAIAKGWGTYSTDPLTPPS